MKYLILLLFPCVTYGNSCQTESNLVSFLDTEYIQIQLDLKEIKSNTSVFTEICDIHQDLKQILPPLLKNINGHIYSWTYLRDNCNIPHANEKLSLWKMNLQKTKILNNIISNSCLNETTIKVNRILE